ncbi:hypothetical protein L0F63_003874 [Massospora cicadina]|nr:hypothetical protein L0F63_003874 [Massospora cicadina]
MSDGKPKGSVNLRGRGDPETRNMKVTGMDLHPISVSGTPKRRGRPKGLSALVDEHHSLNPVAIAPGHLEPYRSFTPGLVSSLDLYGALPPSQPGKRHYYVPEDVEPIAPIPALPPPPPPARIPRAPNCFMLYRQQRCKEVAALNPEMDNNAVSKLVGKMWNSESAEVKESFKLMAKEIKRQHAILYPHYRYSPRFSKLALRKELQKKLTRDAPNPIPEPLPTNSNHSGTGVNELSPQSLPHPPDYPMDLDLTQFLTQDFFTDFTTQQKPPNNLTLQTFNLDPTFNLLMNPPCLNPTVNQSNPQLQGWTPFDQFLSTSTVTPNPFMNWF